MSKKNISFLFSFFVLVLFLLTGRDITKDKPEVASIMVSVTPTPTAATIKHNGVLAKVIKVVDGDTIKIATGETVRYIGIDTPESVKPRSPVECFAREAAKKNEELVLGKTIEMEKDISDKDRYGRLLRYIRIGESLINETLVAEGYAYSYSYPPDIKYQDIFRKAQQSAMTEKKGFWGSICDDKRKATSTPKPQKPTKQPLQN